MPEHIRYYADMLWRFVRTLRRQALAVAIGVVAIYIIPATDRGVIIYKAAVVTFAWVLWHILRHETFGYMDFEKALKRGGLASIAAAIVLAATCLAVVIGLASAF
jgi:prepilin signal peptidase PulO-like enzyme (type II secretory pathway)